ncbi:MAG: VWA domain-containing protein [Spirochaetales bacterium]|nr:VWA domain-containing protein [Spirochaetales bacterium]
MKQVFLIVIILIAATCAYAQSSDLQILPEDIRIEQSTEGGYDLWIRKKPGMNSIMITESTEAIEGSTYAWRNPKYHPVNGDEKRILDGVFLDSPATKYALIDSTPEKTEFFEQAFHIFIPWVVHFGYPWSRNGIVQVLDGTFLSIRAFSRKYGDYDGTFRDNGFVLKLVQKPVYSVPKKDDREQQTSEVDPDIYISDTVDSFSDLAKSTAGDIIFGKGEGDVIDNLRQILNNMDGKTLDLVLALDTTQSMENDIPYLQQSLVPLMREFSGKFETIRIGMMLYRDYFEEYVTRIIPFQITFEDVQEKLDTIKVFGGRDIPEAVYEALYESIHNFAWYAEEKAIVLIGDAPPHPLPRGKITKEMVLDDSAKYGISIHAIILPQ